MHASTIRRSKMIDLAEQLALVAEHSATRWSAMLLALLATLILASTAYAFKAPGKPPPAVVPRFEAAPCPARHAAVLAEESATRGYLVVPEKRTKSNGRTIRLPVATIPSVNQPPDTDPIVHMTGGPGGDALSETDELVKAGLNQSRDLIVMDQRGDLDTQPELTCPEIDQFNILAVTPACCARLRVSEEYGCRSRILLSTWRAARVPMRCPRRHISWPHGSDVGLRFLLSKTFELMASECFTLEIDGQFLSALGIPKVCI